jgi:hypothetical protein
VGSCEIAFIKTHLSHGFLLKIMTTPTRITLALDQAAAAGTVEFQTEAAVPRSLGGGPGREDR